MLGMVVFKNINIFEEVELQESSFNKHDRVFLTEWRTLIKF